MPITTLNAIQRKSDCGTLVLSINFENGIKLGFLLE
jgi:hypothetical protein